MYCDNNDDPVCGKIQSCDLLLDPLCESLCGLRYDTKMTV